MPSLFTAACVAAARSHAPADGHATPSRSARRQAKAGGRGASSSRPGARPNSLATAAVMAALVVPVAAVGPWALLGAQTTRGFASADVGYEAPVNVPTLGGHTAAGGTIGHALGAKSALAVSFGYGRALVQPEPRQEATSGYTSAPPRLTSSRLSAAAELRYRLRGAQTDDASEMYVALGAGAVRAASQGGLGAPAPQVAPQVTASAAVTMPVSNRFGAVLRAGVAAAPNRGDFAVANGLAPAGSVVGLGAATQGHTPAWSMGARVGVSLYWRPVPKPKRIPLQYMPDVSRKPGPVGGSFEGTLLDRAAAQQNAAQNRDRLAMETAAGARDPLAGGDPIATSGGVVRGPQGSYVTRATPYRDSLAALDAMTGRGPRTSVGRREALSRDTVWQLADTVGTLPLAPIMPTPRVQRPLIDATDEAPAAPVAPRRATTREPSREPSRESARTHAARTRAELPDDLRRALSVPMALPQAINAPIRRAAADPALDPTAASDDATAWAAPVREDRVTSRSDDTYEYLTIDPALVDGRVSARTVRRAAALADRHITAERVMEYAIVVTAGEDQLDALLADAYRLRNAIVGAGVPSGRVRVREVPGASGGAMVRLLVRGPREAETWTAPGDETPAQPRLPNGRRALAGGGY